MHFLKVGILFAASTLSKLLSGLVVVKIIAVYIGADGLGKLGQFMSLMSMITILAGGGISTGIIKYVSEFREDRDKIDALVHAASFVTCIASIALAVVLALGAPVISMWLFRTEEYVDIIRVLAAAQVAIGINNFFLGLLNGHKRVKAFAIVNAVSVVLGAGGIAVGCIYYGMRGAMYGLIWMPVCSILLLLPWFRLGLQFQWRRLLPVWNAAKVRNLLGFSAMLLVSVFTMQMSQIVIRNMIASQTTWVEVGYWQAVTRISDAYLQFVTVVLANYYLPRLSALRTRGEVKLEVQLVYKYAMPVLIAMSAMVYLCRDWIIALLFSKDFLPMKEFFTWQLVGDSFKVAAYIGGYVAVARGKTRIYIFAEIFQAGLLLALCYLFVSRFGGVGATYGYCATYVVYFAVVTFALRKYFVGNLDKHS